MLAAKKKFPWQNDILIHVLHEMGFTWKHYVSKRKVSVER
jgi:hypothetical protein